MAQNNEEYIGDSGKVLCLRNSGQIKLQYGNRYINLFDSEGNLNAKIKNLIHVGPKPTNSSQDGFYFTPGSGNILPKFYIKQGNQILEVSNESSKTNLPEGSIIMYKGSQAPDGWQKFNAPTDISGTIYIINSTEQGAGTPDLYDIWLDWLDSNNNRVITATAKMGEPFNQPQLRNLVNSQVQLQYEYSSSDIGVATIDSNGTVRLVSPGWTIIKAETQANGIHKYDYASYTLNVTSAEKAIVIISVSNQSVANTNTTYTPVMGVTGASLSEIELQKTSDPNNIISSISGQMMSLTGNVGTASLRASISETSSHKSANSGFTLTVTGTQKTEVTINASDQTITNDNATYTPTITVTGASLSELTLTKSGDSLNSIISSISGRTLTLGGSTGTVALTATIPETSTHYGKTKGFLLSVTAAQQQSSFEPYTVGLISDAHYCVMRGSQSIVTWDNANDSTTDASSLYDKDLKYLLNNPFSNVDFVASTGDLAEWDINDFIKFTSDFKSAAPNKRFYSCMGNHDHQVVYGTNKWTKYDSNHEEIGSPDGSRWRGVGNYDCPGSLSGQSDLSYYIQKGNDMYIFLSTNYGSQNINHDGAQWAHPQNQLNSSDSYVQQMINLCGVNSFTGNESNFNFQYYSPSDLIWLYNLINNNQNKRKFIFVHHFLPNKAGGGNKFESGQSSVLMGITFHFLNWLNDQYPQKTIWFSGHSHISWRDTSLNGEVHWCNKNYDYIKPSSSDNTAISLESNYTSNKYISNSEAYNRNGSTIRKSGSAWTVHLPSMSRPCTIASNGATPVRNINDCEAAIMRVYENYVEIEKLAYTTSDGGTTYTNAYTIADKTLTVNNDGTGSSSGEQVGDSDYFEIRITNNLNVDALYSGKMEIKIEEISTGTAVWMPLFYSPPTGEYNGKSRWYTNILKIEAGQSKTIRYTKFIDYTDDYGYPDYHEYQISEYANGNYRFNSTDEGPSDNSPNVKFATALTGETDNTTNNAFYIAPLSGTINKNTTYNLIISQLGNNYSGRTLAPYTGSESGGGNTPTPSGNFGTTRYPLIFIRVGLKQNSTYSISDVNTKIKFVFDDGTYVYGYKGDSCEYSNGGREAFRIQNKNGLNGTIAGYMFFTSTVLKKYSNEQNPDIPEALRYICWGSVIGSYANPAWDPNNKETSHLDYRDDQSKYVMDGMPVGSTITNFNSTGNQPSFETPYFYTAQGNPRPRWYTSTEIDQLEEHFYDLMDNYLGKTIISASVYRYNGTTGGSWTEQEIPATWQIYEYDKEGSNDNVGSLCSDQTTFRNGNTSADAVMYKLFV